MGGAHRPGNLPKVLEEQERDVLSRDWDTDVHRLQVVLDPADRSGQMTPKQAERYRALPCRLKGALPIIEQLGFAWPSVLLEP